MKPKPKTIESAPQDGTIVILICKASQAYYPKARFADNKWWSILADGSDTWCPILEDDIPTHWLPIPKYRIGPY